MVGFRGLAAVTAFIACVLINYSASAADRLTVRLDWTPWGSQAPFHLAVQKGLFAKYS